MTNRTILLVDDEKNILTELAKIFTRKGYEVLKAESGEEALRIMSETPVDVQFLDLNLPGMNGLELCREIHRHRPWSITIAVTGYASLFQLVDCREAGFEDYYIKPVEIEDLLLAADLAFKKIERWKQRSELP